MKESRKIEKERSMKIFRMLIAHSTWRTIVKAKMKVALSIASKIEPLFFDLKIASKLPILIL